MTDGQTGIYKIALKEAREAFATAKQRLAEIEIEGYALDDEIAKLRRTITALSALCSEEPFSDHLGITEACMEVMDVQRTIVTTADVVRLLEAIGFDLKSQKNVSASVHAILSRLAAKGKIEKVKGTDEDAVTWKGPKFDPNYVDDIPF